jgi:hypothetical protein
MPNEDIPARQKQNQQLKNDGVLGIHEGASRAMILVRQELYNACIIICTVGTYMYNKATSIVHFTLH